MAAVPPPPVFTVRDAMAACGLINVNPHGPSQAERVAEGLFGNSFETAMSVTIEDINRDLKDYSELTVAEGRIRMLPETKKKIKAFVQWVRDEIRMGRDPSIIPFPVGQFTMYFKRLADHKKFLDNASDIQKATEPQAFTKSILWDDWDQTFRHYLGNVPGHNGVPLKYIIRDDPNPDPTPQSNFLDEYVNMAPLFGEAYEHDSLRVLGLINKYIVGNVDAEGAVKACATENDGRAAYLALKSHYEGEGVLQTKVIRAEKALETLFYQGEDGRGMKWDQFETELNHCYAIINRERGFEMYSESQKIRKLQTRIRPAFLAQNVAVIDARLCEQPMTLTFKGAMAIYRAAVQKAYPVGIIRGRTTTTRAGIAETNRGRGGGRGGHGGGGRGRGGRNQGRQDRRHNGNGGNNNNRGRNRYHRDMEQITLTNGQRINYHPSFRFTDEELALFTEEQKTRMQRQRAEWNRRNGRNGNNNNGGGNQTQRELAEIRSTLASLVQRQGSIPDAVSTNQQTQVSQVSQGSTALVDMMPLSRRISIAKVVTSRVISSNNTRNGVQEPAPGTVAENEMDSNADTTCLGPNFIVLSYTQRIAQVYAYDPSLPPTEVPIVSGATAYDCEETNITYILVVHEALYYGTKLDHSLWNPNQVRSHGNPLWDNPFDPDRPLGIELSDVFIPLRTRGTKLLFKTRAPTAHELENCKHIDVTSIEPWEPQNVQLSQVQTVVEMDPAHDPRSNECELQSIGMDPSAWREVKQVQAYDARSQDVPVRATFQSSERRSRVTPEQLSERFGISVERARATLRATLQQGTRSAILPLARRYRANRMYDRPRLKGKFSTDTGYFPCRSLRGNIASQIYFHKCGFYANYNIQEVNDAHIGPTLPRFISEYGIPEHLTMDGAQVQVGRKTKFMDTIRRANIDHHISRPRRPQENPAEGGIRELKRRFYRLVTKHNIPMRLWDFVLDYVVDIMNVTVNYSRYSDGRVPLEIITGITADISEYLDFTIYGWVFYRTDARLGVNHIGRWLGVSHRVGPAMTYWVLPKSGIPISTDTVQVVTQAELMTDEVKELQAQWREGTRRVFEAANVEVNWDRVEDFDPDLLFDLEGEDEEFLRNFNMPIDVDGIAQGAGREGTEGDGVQDEAVEEGDDLDAPNYVGMEIGLRRGDEGGLQRATVRRRILDEDGRPSGVATRNPMTDTRRFEVEFQDGEKEIFNANILAENILEQVDEYGHKHRLMEEIGGHRKLDDAVPKEKGWVTTEQGQRRRRQTTRGWELYLIWKDGSSNFISLREMKESFPIETAMYAVEHGLSEEPAFAWWVPHVLKKKERFISKVKSKYWERTHKYGIRIPKTIKEALEIDEENNNRLWRDAIIEEMKNNRVAFEEYNGDISKLVGYKRITGHMVFDVKLGENFRRKARFVADGHLTEAPASMTYSTVVSRDSVRILLMIAALNGLDLQCADIQNAFLTAPNLEKCYMIAGPEFLDEAGKTFIVRRALYGLKSAALAFRSFLAQNIEDLGFFPSEADPDVWMRPAVKANGATYYEYILCYVDDIMCMSVNAMETMKQLQTKFKFKKDLIQPPTSYLGARVRKKVIDGYSMWTISSFDYVQAAVKNVEDTIKDKKWALPGKAPTPMSSAYEPELDGSPELGPEDHKYYQELIGVLRWATELGRVDILHEVSLLSQYQACPREGHMNQLMRIFSFLQKKPKFSLYMDHRPWTVGDRTMRSNVEDFKKLYRDAKEQLPDKSRMPEPRGEFVDTTAYVDASHAANKKTRRSHTGYVIFVNSAPVIWYSKRQNTVEASTFGSEFIALKSCLEAITHLRYKLRMFGIPIDGPTLVFCDNESVVKNSALVESVLNKKHNSIAYHYVRWNVAAEVVLIAWISTDFNLADIFTKRLDIVQRQRLLGEWTY